MQPSPFTGRDLWGFDTETHLIQPGLLAPPLVCGSWAIDRTRPDVKGLGHEGILDKAETRRAFRNILEGPCVLVGHNLCYDLGVMCADDPTLVHLVFAKLDRGECFDTMIAEQLILIHEGTLGVGHSNSGGGFSLEELGKKYLGVNMSADKSGPDAWRLRYAELDGIRLDQWPEAALAYPIRDARYTYDVAVKQIQDGRNLHDLPAQLRAAWALHLSAMWGIRTDKPWVDEFTVKVTKEHTESRARFLAAGLLKVNRCTKEQDPDVIDVKALGTALAATPAGTLRREQLSSAHRDVEIGRRMRYGTDKKALEAAITAAYQGEPPRGNPTKTERQKAQSEGREAVGNIRSNKDTLWESGDKLLEAFADAQDNEKFFSTYLKVLAQGTEVPINPRINILVDTGRCSYSKPNLQNLPRGSEAGRPREAFISRDGMVFCSMDYPTLELRTLAFALEYLGFESEMAKALRAGFDLHEMLGAQILGASLEQFQKLKKGTDEEKQRYKDFRQMAKAGNFGLPGGLGATKLVLFARANYGSLCLLSGRATECGTVKHFDKRSKTTVCKACLDVAYELKKMWFAAWPEMERYFELVKEWTSAETRMVPVEGADGIFGEPDYEEIYVGAVTQLISGRVRGACTFTNGANSIFQGLAADIAKRALWLVSREQHTDPSSPLWDSHLAVFVHDELFEEMPIDRASAAAARACELMAQAFAEFCGAREGYEGIPCEVEPAFAFRWYKDAFTATDSAGKTVPVEKCPACSKLAPVGWDGIVLPHKNKDMACVGAGKPNPVVVARLPIHRESANL